MGIMDRDWYREELAWRRRGLQCRDALKGIAAVVTIGLFVVAAVAMTRDRAVGGQPGACGYYLNSQGHQVPRPCGDARLEGSPPGATAICRDSTYSFSEHPFAPGTCSHHGGVFQHVGNMNDAPVSIAPETPSPAATLPRVIGPPDRRTGTPQR
jgi:Protein of unknown function (DUF3761)